MLCMYDMTLGVPLAGGIWGVWAAGGVPRGTSCSLAGRERYL